MKRTAYILLIVFTACGGKLSDEQRKQMKEGMEQQKIVQLSNSEIVTAALEQGQTIFNVLEKSKFDHTKIDSIAHHYRVKIYWRTPGTADAKEIEQQLIEAYVSGMVTGSLQDNIQELHKADQSGYDSLLYSKPIVTPMPDGVEKLEGVWNIYLSKKQVVLMLSGKQ
jgi:hypothetical protein